METSKNLATQVVNDACQDFQRLVDKQAVLMPIIQKTTRRAKVCMAVATIGAALMALIAIICLFNLITVQKTIQTFNEKPGSNAWFDIILCIGFLVLIALAMHAHYDAKKRACLRSSQLIAEGRLNYVKGVINQTLIAHICTSDDDDTADLYFRRMKEITSGFFAIDFDSSLTPEEVAEIKNWLRMNYTACLRAD